MLVCGVVCVVYVCMWLCSCMVWCGGGVCIGVVCVWYVYMVWGGVCVCVCVCGVVWCDGWDRMGISEEIQA